MNSAPAPTTMFSGGADMPLYPARKSEMAWRRGRRPWWGTGLSRAPPPSLSTCRVSRAQAATGKREVSTRLPRKSSAQGRSSSGEAARG